jgi:septal ring factor EnvC (AmiA/AmiB activator)
MRYASLLGGSLAALLLLSIAAPGPNARAQTAAADRENDLARATERLRTLRAEADRLLAHEKTLLSELRRLEVERKIEVERLRQIDRDRAAIETELGSTTRLSAALEQRRDAQLPALRARLVELYKLGRGGYVRMLFDVNDARDVGRAIRTVSAMAALDRERVRAHQTTLASLERARASLESRRRELDGLRSEATKSRAALDKAVADRLALVRSIDQRRDLNAQLSSELAAARQQLQQTVTAIGDGTPAALPIGTFRGTLDWPAAGRVMTPFGANPPTNADPGASRNGIEIATAAGTPVTAVHEGVVAYAAPFTGYGTLVILDHGRKAYSLYGYLDGTDLTKGRRVSRDQRLGTVGLSPTGTPLLYFELRIDGRAVDPLQWLKPRNSVIRDTP